MAISASYKLELERKAIHLSSLWMAFVMYLLPFWVALSILLIGLVGMLTFEYARYHPKTLQYVPKSLTRTLRVHEQGDGKFRLTGASYTLLAAVAALLIFPTTVAVTAFTIMIVGDAFAALIGKPFGRTKIGDKSVEGSAAFVISSMLALGIFAAITQPPAGYMIAALVATLAGMVSEILAARWRVDDNLAITLGAGIVMSCIYGF